MALLELIRGPEDVRRLTRDQLQPLADEVRRRLIDVVSQTGGHIGAGLGVVELTVALGYCFDSPRDKIVWDVGHQGYPWKILTGRNDRLPTLRQAGGLSGFLRRSESPHDQFGAGHAGTGLSAAYGIAAARDLVGEQFKVVAVVGDGALTCGLPYEAMNNAGHSGRDIIMVLNDNGMSIAPNVGAINKYLGSIIASPVTVRIRERVKGLIESVSHIVGGQKLVDFAKTMEESIKNFWSPGMLFEELGFRYFGPIDGHNIAQLVQTFEIVKTLKGPRVVHVITERGKPFPFSVITWTTRVHPTTRSRVSCDRSRRVRPSGLRCSGRPSPSSRGNTPSLWRSPRPCRRGPGPAFSKRSGPTVSSTSASPRRTPRRSPGASPRRASGLWSRSTRRSCSAPTIASSTTSRSSSCP